MSESGDRFSEGIQRYIEGGRRAVRDATDRGAERIASAARRFAPHLSGELAGTIRARPAQYLGANRFEAIIEVGTEYARIQEFGGTVEPKNGPFLVIPPDRGKNPGTFAKVRMVEVPATHYMERAVQTEKFNVRREYIIAFTELAEE